MFIKHPMIIRGNEFKTVVVVLTLSLVVTPLMVYPVYTFPIRQQRIDDICIGRSRELNIILYDFNSANQEPRVVQLVVLVGIVISMVEFFMYAKICIYLNDHNRAMKSILPDSTLRKRHEQNVIDLFGNILSFATDNIFPVLCYINIQILPVSDLTKNILYAFALSTYGMYGFCQILISMTLKKELLNLLDALLLLPCIFKVLGFFAYVGLIRPQHAHSMNNLRNRYLLN